MLPIEIKNEIIGIKNLFYNYKYMKKTKVQLEILKNEIIKIINDLDYYKNKSIIDVSFASKKMTATERNQILNSELSVKTKEFYENCLKVKLKFKIFLDKINTRLNTLEINKTEFTESEKNDFYEIILRYISENNINSLEKLLNKNLIDVNYFPPFVIDDDIVAYNTPLIIYACENNNLDIVKMLYNNNANLNVNIDNEYIHDTTPLTAAIDSAEKNKDELIIYLLDNGASPNFIGPLSKLPLNAAINDLQLFEKMIKKYGANVNLEYPYGTPLIYACATLKFDAIKVLLDNGANVNFRNYENDTALHYLFGVINDEIPMTKIKNAIDWFIAKNFNFNLQNNEGDTVLYNIIYSPAEISIIKYLLNKNITYNVNLQNNEGDSILHNLLERYNKKSIEDIIEIINWFIKYDFNINVQNNLGETILHKNFKNFININITKHLLDQNIDINVKTNDGNTALHYLINLAEHRNFVMIEKIIALFFKYNFQFNLQNNEGNTILHQAVEMEISTSIIEQLLNSGCDPNIANNENETALQLAGQCNNAEILEVISKFLSTNLSNNNKLENCVRAQKRKHNFGDDNESGPSKSKK